MIPSPPPRERLRRLLRRLRGLRGILALAAALVAVVVGHRIGDVIRGAPVEDLLLLGELPAPSSAAFARKAAGLADVSLFPGNQVEILVDEALFAALEVSLARARSHILLYSYYCQPGSTGDRIAAVLGDRARAGVAVLLLGDGFGCREYLEDVGEELRSAGGRVAAYRPVRWWALHRSQHRNHGRVVVVDGVEAFTGGFGIADAWAGRSDEPPWRDTNVRVRGPAVAGLESAFLASWAEATGRLPLLPGRSGADATEGPSASAAREVPAGTDDAPGAGERAGRIPAVSGVTAGVLVSRPGLGPTPADRFLNLSLAGARDR